MERDDILHQRQSEESQFCSYNKCNGLGKITPKVGFQLFDPYVNPVLEYCAEFWSVGKEF